MQLAEKTVLVTGAGRGLGLAIAGAVVAAGGRVAINDLDPATVDAAVQALGPAALAVPGDIGDEATVAGIVQTVVERWGRLDGLVCNAGIVSSKPFEEVDPAEWQRVMRINLDGVYLCCRAAVPVMLQQGGGRIVTISSVAGRRGGGLFGTTAYSAAKAGVLGLTRALARELGGRGIAVNAVAPGPSETAMVAGMTAERRQRVLSQIPLGRFGRPEDIAGAVVFLLSEAAAYVNGETLTVDGGLISD